MRARVASVATEATTSVEGVPIAMRCWCRDAYTGPVSAQRVWAGVPQRRAPGDRFCCPIVLCALQGCPHISRRERILRSRQREQRKRGGDDGVVLTDGVSRIDPRGVVALPPEQIFGQQALHRDRTGRRLNGERGGRRPR